MNSHSSDPTHEAPGSGVPGQRDRPLRAIVIGAGVGGRLLINELLHHMRWALQPAAIVDDDPDKWDIIIDGVPVLGSINTLPNLVRDLKIDAVMIAIPSASPELLDRISDLLAGVDVRVFTMPSVARLLQHQERGQAVIDLQLVSPAPREPSGYDWDDIRAFLAGKRVLITGAAGSIGRELTFQVASFDPERIIGLDLNESGLFELGEELKARPRRAHFVPVVGSVADPPALADLSARHEPQIVFHAAAYKHVSLMEAHPRLAVMTNTIGTQELMNAVAKAGCERFVLVSTDKAVRPTSVMGATKLLAERVVRAIGAERGISTCAVRFGNVIGSRGSVVPLFDRQIATGGPVTVTDPHVTRYFMTISEAVTLILQAGAMGHDGVVYMLDMGEPISIDELAKRMIRLRGLEPGRDIEIVYTGLRQGEKLAEELTDDFEVAEPTSHPKIRMLRDSAVPGSDGFDSLRPTMMRLRAMLDSLPDAGLRDEVLRLSVGR